MFQRMVLFLFAFAALGQEITVNHTVFLKKGWTAVWVASQYSLSSDDFRFYTYRYPVGHPKAGQIIPVNDPKTGKVTRAQLAAFRDLAVDTQIDIPANYRRTVMYKPAPGETLASVCSSKISGSNCVSELSKINRVKSPRAELLSEITVPTTFRVTPVEEKKSGDKKLEDKDKKKSGQDPVPSAWDKFVKNVRLQAGSFLAMLFSKVASIPDRYWLAGLGLLMAAIVIFAASRGGGFTLPRSFALGRPKFSVRPALQVLSRVRWPNFRWPRPSITFPKITVPDFITRRQRRRANMEYRNYDQLLKYAGGPQFQTPALQLSRFLHPAAIVDWVGGLSLWSLRLPSEVVEFSKGFIERVKPPLDRSSDVFVVTRFNWWHRRIVIRVWGTWDNPFPNMFEHKNDVHALWKELEKDINDERFKPLSYRAIACKMWRCPGVARGKQGVEFSYTFTKGKRG